MHVGLGEQDRALFEQHVGERCIRFGAIALQERCSRGSRKADRVDVVLEHDRQAGKRAELCTSRAGSVDLASLFGKPRLIEIGHDVQIRVSLVSGEQRLSIPLGAEFPAPM